MSAGQGFDKAGRETVGAGAYYDSVNSLASKRFVVQVEKS